MVSMRARTTHVHCVGDLKARSINRCSKKWAEVNVRPDVVIILEHYHLAKNNYSFDALQAYCFRINM